MRKLSILFALFGLLMASPSWHSLAMTTVIGDLKLIGKLGIDLPTPTRQQPFDIHTVIGIADVRTGGTSCLRTKNGKLTENTPIAIIISLNEAPQRVLKAIVLKKLERSCARYASETGDKNPGSNHFYSLNLSNPADEEIPFAVGIAFIEPKRKIRIRNNLAEADLNGDGTTEYFRRCAGYEGIHFTVWSGKPLKGKRIWHSFYYLDYDTEPNCKEKDWKGTGN